MILSNTSLKRYAESDQVIYEMNCSQCGHEFKQFFIRPVDYSKVKLSVLCAVCSDGQMARVWPEIDELAR